MSEDDVSVPVQGLSATRSRRERKGKSVRKAALERLRAAKSRGEKVKYEALEIKNVYDVVDEREYAAKVKNRQDDDWIVDDGSGEYIDDGREIFDEEQDEFDHLQKLDSEDSRSRAEKDLKRKVKLAKSTDIKTILSNLGSKKKSLDKCSELGHDELLIDILHEMSSTPSEQHVMPIKPLRLKKSTVVPPSSRFHRCERRKAKQTFSPPSSLTRVCFEPNGVDPCTVSIEPEFSKAFEEPVSPPSKRSKCEASADTGEFKYTDVGMTETEFKLNDSQAATNLFDLDKIEFIDGFESSKQGISLEKTDIVDSSPFKINPLKWDMFANDAYQASNLDIAVDSSNLPVVSDENGICVLRFYWIDAYENTYQKPGVVHLFGKTYVESAKAYVSCCVVVENIQRHVYLLPRARNISSMSEVNLSDVYKEFDEKVAPKYGIMKFKTKVVEKKFVFGSSDIPEYSEYLEIQYSTDFPILPQDLSGDTFSDIFGTNQAALESLLIRGGIHGPCWLDVKMPQLLSKPISWCKIEARTCSPANILPTKNIQPPPPLVVISVAIKTVPNLRMHHNEVIALAGLVHNSFPIDKCAPKPPFQRMFCAISKPADCVFPFNFYDVIKKRKVDVFITPTERSILTFFLAKMQKIDPDVIVGHNTLDFDLDVLLHRIAACKVDNWSRIGRMRRINMPRITSSGRFFEKAVACGRIICDVKLSSKELIKCKSYDLTTLTEQVLHRKRTEVTPIDIKGMFISSEKLLRLIELTWLDANFALNIACELNALPLAHQITTIAGNVLSRTLLGGRSERNEFLLLHAFYEKGFLPPDKRIHSKTKNTKKESSYAGGLVLEPRKGFYDKFILLLDFNSLYPSIIQEYNICFTTLDRHPPFGSGIDNDQYIPEIPESGLDNGVLPTEIKKLVDRRREVKKLMKNPSLSEDEHAQYNIRQQALKLTANSMYGCLGFSNSRFFAKPLAALITRIGREILLQTKELALRMDLEVIYGDTDSIMINTNSNNIDHVYELGNKVKAEVNKLYRLLEIDIDGVYKSMLLLKKKKYAALKVEKALDGTYYTKKELKGLDIIRRDWSELAKVAGNYAVTEILSEQPREQIVQNIHEKLEEIGQKTRTNEYPLHIYTINKELTKDPTDYPSKNSLPHVTVALRLNRSMHEHLKCGDVVSYVICKDNTNNPATQRAYAIKEVEKNEKLMIDHDYYLAQQVHPVVMRLCEPLDGTDSIKIARCLGLDPSGYKQSMDPQRDNDKESIMTIEATEEEKFSNCVPVQFTCPETGKTIDLKFGVFAETSPLWKPTLALECAKDDSKIIQDFLYHLKNQITQQIHAHISRYYESWLMCDDTACLHRTRSIPAVHEKQGVPCPACARGILHPEYSSKRLHQQLCFYKLQFDVDYALRKHNQDPVNSKAVNRLENHRVAYRALMEAVNLYLRGSAFNEVKMPQLFSWMNSIE